MKVPRTVLLASKALGLDSSSWIKMKREYRPNENAKSVYDRVFRIYKDLYISMKERFGEISRLQQEIVN